MSYVDYLNLKHNFKKVLQNSKYNQNTVLPLRKLIEKEIKKTAGLL